MFETYWESVLVEKIGLKNSSSRTLLRRFLMKYKYTVLLDVKPILLLSSLDFHTSYFRYIFLFQLLK